METHFGQLKAIILVLCFFFSPIHVESAMNCTLQITGIDASQFPDIVLTVYAVDDNGFALPGLERNMRVSESTEWETTPDTGADVSRDETKGRPVAVSLLVDVRNGTTIEELDATRSFARSLVLRLNELAPLGQEGGDHVALWVPSLGATPRVSWGQENYVTLVNEINQVLPVFEQTSADIGDTLRMIFDAAPPDNAPHIVVLAGKIANLDSTESALNLAAQAQQRNIFIYAAGVSSSDVLFLKSLAAMGYVPASETGGLAIADDLLSRFKGEYKLKFRSLLTPGQEQRRISLTVEGGGCQPVETEFSIPELITADSAAKNVAIVIVLVVGLTMIALILLVISAFRIGAVRPRS